MERYTGQNTEQRKGNLPEIEECLTLLLQNVKAQEIIQCPIDEAWGMVLAETVCAGMPVPPYPKSAMDGYAVRAEEVADASGDHPVTLKVAAELFAGDHKEIRYEPGTAVRVMTGAFVPEGYDAVVKQEDTDYGEESVQVYAPSRPGQNYCGVGEEISCGDVIAGSGTRLSPVHIGLFAETGKSCVPVYRPVRVAILCTGSELCETGEPLGKGKIYNSISHMLAAAVRREGLQVVFRELCPDEDSLLADRLSEALRAADIVITTGGVSVGKRDIVPKVLCDIGAKILFRRANIQPGTPTTGSTKDGRVILSLSGNPYAALVNFEIYFWPLAAKMMGHEGFAPVKERAVLWDDYPKTNRMRRFIRAKVSDKKVYLPTRVHSSSVISNLTECNCLIDLEPGRSVKAGEEVSILHIRGGI